MRKLNYLTVLILTVLLAFGCSKKDEGLRNAPITGKWGLVAQKRLYSDWVEASNEFIEFKSNGILTHTYADGSASWSEKYVISGDDILIYWGEVSGNPDFIYRVELLTSKELHYTTYEYGTVMEESLKFKKVD